MTFEEFLKFIRKRIGSYCTEGYWRYTYDRLTDKSLEGVKKELPYLAVNAIGTDYSTRA